MLQIIDITWRYLQESKRYIPLMKFRETDTDAITELELPNFKFNFKLSEDKNCIGYFREGDYIKCPINSVIRSPKYTVCPICEKAQGFKDAFFFGAEPNENIKGYMQSRQLIYLAYFEPGLLKVGTATEARRFKRPIEQDALIYSFIAESDGYNVQRFEHSISLKLGIRETVKSGHKLKFITRKPNYESAKVLIESSFNRIKAAFQGTEFESWLFNNVDIVDLTEVEGIYYPEAKPEIIKSTQFLIGDYCGLRGRFLLLNNYDNIVGFDERNLIGRTVEYSAESYRYEFAGSDQLSF